MKGELSVKLGIFKNGKEGVTTSKAGRIEKFNRKYGLNKKEA